MRVNATRCVNTRAPHIDVAKYLSYLWYIIQILLSLCTSFITWPRTALRQTKQVVYSLATKTDSVKAESERMRKWYSGYGYDRIRAKQLSDPEIGEVLRRLETGKDPPKPSWKDVSHLGEHAKALITQ